MEPASKHMLPKGSSGHAEDEKETDMRNGVQEEGKGISQEVCLDHLKHEWLRSISSDRMRSLRRRSITPRRRRFTRDSPSPPRRNSSYSGAYI
ncbi:hypothetical protein NC652_022400 [Populus alba x Populus x berolinensis]|nr:hypothetical protein NC652_022400 [Populus alba x Populus x berolinensis]